ncbi:MAG: hypothetical protein WBM98_00555 [Maribacter sp.]|uniref:hypothetical protein n=1 Tax=Maribacter sp. TaxID=1897614 RepID=UPI003C720C56
MKKDKKTRLEILEQDHKRLLNSIADFEKEIESILCSKKPDQIEVTKLIQHKTNAERLADEKENVIRYERKRENLGESDSENRRKNDNYNIVRGSYIKIKNDENQ